MNEGGSRSEKAFIVIVGAFTAILLIGYFIIPYELLAHVSGIAGVILPGFVKLYDAYKKMQPKFCIDVDGAEDITLTVPRNTARVQMKIRNVKNVVIEGNGEDVVITKGKK